MKGWRGIDLSVWPPRYDSAFRPDPQSEYWFPELECALDETRNAVILWQDVVYTQVCDPKTFEPLPFGSEGTPVYTHLERTSQPMIRLVSGDLTRWTNDLCPCGRTYPRLPAGIYGRIDDMFIVRGENVYPSAVEDTLRARLGVHPVIELVPEGTIPRTEFKARRVIDDRELYRQKRGTAPF